MKNVLKIVAALALLIAGVSCIVDPKSETPNEENALVLFSLRVPGRETSATRTMTEADENAVTEIDVLVFEPDGGLFVSRTGASGSDITSNTLDSSIKTFTVRLRQGDFDMVLLAGSRSILAEVDLGGKKKADALALLYAAMPSDGKWPDETPFPMWGDVGNITISGRTDLTDEDNRIQLTRMVARVDVQVTATNFKLTSVDIYNYNTRGALVPRAAVWDATAHRATAPDVPSTSTLAKGPIRYDGTAVNTETNRVEREIYLFECENHTTVDGTAGKEQLARTCLVVGGIWDADGSGTIDEADGAATFYRVDVLTGNDTDPIFRDIVRNSHYIFNVTGVSGRGYVDSETAFESAPANIEAGVVEWNRTGLDYIVFDGQNVLAVSDDELTLSKLAQDAVLTVCTDYPAGFTATVWDNADGTGTSSRSWLTLADNTGAGDNSPHDVTLSLTENDGADRTAYIHVTAGRLDYAVKVTQLAIDNSEYNVAIRAADGGTAIATPSRATAGTTITLLASAVSTKMVTGWEVEVNGVVETLPAANPVTYIMPAADIFVTPLFEAAAFYMATVTAPQDIGFATVSPSQASDTGVRAGTLVTVSATSDNAHSFDHWIATGMTLSEVQTKANPLRISMPPANVNFEPVFVATTIDINAPGNLIIFEDAGDDTYLTLGTWGGKINKENLYSTVALFKFGSVVGITHTANYTSFSSNMATLNNAVRFNPQTTVNITNWAGVPYQTTGSVPTTTLANAKAGKGDPCRLLGLTAAQIKAMTTEKEFTAALDARLDVYKGWRMPTNAEHTTFAGAASYIPSSATGAQYVDMSEGDWTIGSTGNIWPNPENPGVAKFLKAGNAQIPGVGNRNQEGAIHNHGSAVILRSSDYAAGGLFITKAQIAVQTTGLQYNGGYAVRCVRDGE